MRVSETARGQHSPMLAQFMVWTWTAITLVAAGVVAIVHGSGPLILSVLLPASVTLTPLLVLGAFHKPSPQHRGVPTDAHNRLTRLSRRSGTASGDFPELSLRNTDYRRVREHVIASGSLARWPAEGEPKPKGD